MKFKYGAIVFSGLLGVSAILAACGARGKFNQVDDGKIKLASSLTSRSASTALQKVVEKYNKVKGVNDYPIEITQIAGGYDGGRTDLQTRVNVKDTTNFYNLILNYPDLVSTLGRVGMELPFDKVKTDKLADRFLDFNNRISAISKKGIYGIPVSLSTEVLSINGPVLHYILNSAQGKVSSVTSVQRTADSGSGTTNNNGVTKPLKIDKENESTKKLWEEIENKAKENGKKTSSSRRKRNLSSSKQMSTQTQPTDNSNDANQSDQAIEKTWGKYQEVEGGLKDYTFKASVFENWHDLLDFSNRVAKSFSNINTNTNKKGTDIQGVLGIDSTPNSLFTSVFAAGGGNYDNFFYKVANGRADFSNFKNKGTSYQNLQKVYGDYKGLIDSNGLFVNKGGSYSSNFQKFHQLAYSISSTSGFFYSFAGENSKRLKFDGGNFIEFPGFTQAIYAPENNSQSGGESGDQTTNNEANLLGTFKIKSSNKSKSSSSKSSTKAETGKTSGGDQNQGKKGEGAQNQGKKGEDAQNQGKNGGEETTIYLYKNSIPSGKNKGENAILIDNKTIVEQLESAAKKEDKKSGESTTEQTQIQSKSVTEQKQPKIIGYTTTGNVHEDNKHIFPIDKLTSDRNFDRKIIVGATEETLDKSNTLQSNEAIVLPAPSKYKSTDTNKVTITQGPNIIGIHANEKENAETQKFVDWFLNSPQTWEGKGKGKEQTNKTAAEFFAESASYILPLKEIFEQKNEKKEGSDQKDSKSNGRGKQTNLYTEKALELFRGISTDQIVSYSDPSDFRSGRFRDGIGATFNAAVSSKASFEKFVQNFIATLGSDI